MEFLAEKELVTIIPNFSEGKISLMQVSHMGRESARDLLIVPLEALHFFVTTS